MKRAIKAATFVEGNGYLASLSIAEIPEGNLACKIRENLKSHSAITTNLF